MFNAPYPSMSRAFVNITSDCIPLVHLDFDHGLITAVDPSPFSAFRLSPNLMTAVGNSLSGEIFITMALVAKALTANIESMRAYLEAMIGDEDLAAGRQRSIGGIVEVRTQLENKFLNLCPPKAPGSHPNIAEEWLLDVEKFLAEASNPANQPIEAIPWF
jgi:hypothetical protein